MLYFIVLCSDIELDFVSFGFCNGDPDPFEVGPPSHVNWTKVMVF